MRKANRTPPLPPVFRSNLYWSGSPLGQSQAIFPGAADWAQWRAAGNDTGSLWLDPVFRSAQPTAKCWYKFNLEMIQNPPVRNPSSGDYRLAPESPARLLGIMEIDTSEIGPRGGQRDF